MPPEERSRLVGAIASLCKPGGMVIWTRGLKTGMSRLHQIKSLFVETAREEVRLSFTSDKKWAVATHRYHGPTQELPGSGRIFHFQRCAG